MDRFVKFHLIGPYPGNELTGVRGWCEENQDRYEITLIDGKWECSRVFTFVSDPNDWGFKHIPAADDLFSCMVAAEQDAIAILQRL